MTDTNLTGNTASNGGAVYQNLVGLRAVGCRFEGNRAELLGGALLVSGWGAGGRGEGAGPTNAACTSEAPMRPAL